MPILSSSYLLPDACSGFENKLRKKIEPTKKLLRDKKTINLVPPKINMGMHLSNHYPNLFNVRK